MIIMMTTMKPSKSIKKNLIFFIWFFSSFFFFTSLRYDYYCCPVVAIMNASSAISPRKKPNRWCALFGVVRRLEFKCALDKLTWFALEGFIDNIYILSLSLFLSLFLRLWFRFQGKGYKFSVYNFAIITNFSFFFFFKSRISHFTLYKSFFFWIFFGMLVDPVRIIYIYFRLGWESMDFFFSFLNYYSNFIPENVRPNRFFALFFPNQDEKGKKRMLMWWTKPFFFLSFVLKKKKLLQIFFSLIVLLSSYC